MTDGSVFSKNHVTSNPTDLRNLSEFSDSCEISSESDKGQKMGKGNFKEPITSPNRAKILSSDHEGVEVDRNLIDNTPGMYKDVTTPMDVFRDLSDKVIKGIGKKLSGFGADEKDKTSDEKILDVMEKPLNLITYVAIASAVAPVAAPIVFVLAAIIMPLTTVKSILQEKEQKSESFPSKSTQYNSNFSEQIAQQKQEDSSARAISARG